MQAVIALREVAPFEHDEEEHLGERERQKREVDAVEAHDERADDERHQRHERHRERDREPKVRELGKEARYGQERHVPAHAVEHRLAVGQEACVAEQQIEPDRSDAGDQNLGRKSPVAADRMDREREERKTQCRQRIEAQRLHPRITSLSPSSPDGRTKSTSAIAT